MINRRLQLLGKTISGLAGGGLIALQAASFVYDAEKDLIGTGDFDGDGRADVVLVDKASGKYRLGYQLTEGTYTWVNHRLSGIKDVTALAVGRLFTPNQDALAFTSADGNAVAIVDVSNPKSPSKATPVAFLSLGPSGVAAIDLGGAGNTPLHDLAIGSIYNDPDPFKLAFLRNSGAKLEVAIEESEKAQMTRANRAALKVGGPEYLIGLWSSDQGDTFRVLDLSGGTAKVVAEAPGLPKGADYALGNFRGSPLKEVLVFKAGTNTVQLLPVEEAGNGTFRFGAAKTFQVAKPLRLLVPLPAGKGPQFLALYEKGESAEVFACDGANPPTSVQVILPKPGDRLFGAVGMDKDWLVFSGADYSRFATHYQPHKFAGVTNAGAFLGKLASMADSDDMTVPDIHQRIVEVLQKEQVAKEGDMRVYTNTIPGAPVNYVMVPIPGGEFTLGSPGGEADRKADEGPQKKVKISPFWMGRCEVTWNEYELFMFPDDEKKLRENFPTEDYVNKVSDAVTRPSKPYMEMSFGMGKEGNPAISMTQHAANKYCHWLSAKTGHFYRLPTEAEWEYACRAGTTTAYWFGDDAAKLADFAWFEQNSDFKYSKVGKKKPNPWGLYDMHGNVWEWCLDQYEPNYNKLTEALNPDPWNRATLAYPHVVRGGSFDDDGAKLRSAARRASDRSWKARDPQLPKSIWWFTDAQTVGFRIVRPLNVPPPDELQKCWTSGVERD